MSCSHHILSTWSQPCGRISLEAVDAPRTSCHQCPSLHNGPRLDTSWWSQWCMIWLSCRSICSRYQDQIKNERKSSTIFSSWSLENQLIWNLGSLATTGVQPDAARSGATGSACSGLKPSPVLPGHCWRRVTSCERHEDTFGTHTQRYCVVSHLITWWFFTSQK